MPFSKRVEQWRPLVVQILSDYQIPFPDDLILAVIHVESRGYVGSVNPKSGASGLMQVMPITILDFNQRHQKNYTLVDMRGRDEISAKKQIEVGINTLAHYWRIAHKYLSHRLGQSSIPIDDLSRIADLYYAAGPKPTEKRLDQLPIPSWSAMEKMFASWAAMPHPRRVFKTPKNWNLSDIENWLDKKNIESPIKLPPDPKIGFAVGVLILIAVEWIMKGKKL